MMKSKQVALSVMHAVLQAADPVIAIKTHVRVHDNQLWIKGNKVIDDLRKFDKTFILGAGKASCEMASACLQVGLKASGGLIITKHKHGKLEHRTVCEQHSVKVVEASHPVPCEDGAKATLDVFTLLKEHDSPKTLILWVASGGGSALTGGVGVRPYLDLAALKQSIQWLLDSGADITQVNAVRKHICAAHGGKLAQAAGRSTVVTLCLSDVINSPVDAIAGGPTAPDHSTVDDCRRILTKYSAKHALVEPLQRAFFSKIESDLVKENPTSFPPNVVPPFVVADLKLAMEAGAAHCKRNFPEINVLKLTSQVAGEASDVGRLFAAMATETDIDRPFLLLAGGETTVSMDSTKSGLGGRNQEMALAAAVHLSSDAQASASTCFLALGTDGTDGPTNAAGACVDMSTVTTDTTEAALQALERHDSYNFLQSHAKEAHLITGPTGTNVMDIILVCDYPEKESTNKL